LLSGSSLVAVYFILWWLVFFVTLPFGIHTQDEEESGIVLGTVPSAPTRPMLLRKALISTVVSAVLLAGFWLAYDRLGWNLEALSRVSG
jgi:predicted secreted protein